MSSFTQAEVTVTTTRPIEKEHKPLKVTLENIREKLKKEADGKEGLNLVFVGILLNLEGNFTRCVGHVDAGKSTLVGHLLFLLGKVDAKTMKKYPFFPLFYFTIFYTND